MAELQCKLLVIGGGPGGYVCAIRAGQLGIDTILVEKSALGGTCLNVGCIPSKALIHAADEFSKLQHAASGQSRLGIMTAGASIDFKATGKWKDSIVGKLTTGVGALLKRARVRVINGEARLIDGKTIEINGPDGPQVVRAENVVIATGSVPVELPSLPFGGSVMSSTQALALDHVPESLAVVGGGYIGLEIGTAFRKLGSRVTVVEYAPRILPQYDADLTRPVMTRLEELGIRVLTQTRAVGLDSGGTGLVTANPDGKEETIAADRILVTVGRRPATEGWGLDQLDLSMNGAFIRIDDACRTSMRGVFAIGDVTGEPMLAHRAMAQGEMVAEIVAGHKRKWDKACIPAVCFTDPELVVAGKTPEQAQAEGMDVTVSQFPFRANGRAMTMERDDGFVRIVARADNHVIVGLQGVGHGIAELAAAFGLAIEMGALLEDIAATVHAHPGLGEALQEAALSGLGHAIHL